MNTKYPYIRQIKPEEFADFLNAKGGNKDTFKCPICGNEHQTLIDNMPINDDSTASKVVLQPVLPAFLYPNALLLKNAIENKEYPEHHQQFTYGGTVGYINQLTYREVLHIICNNCGYIRTFSKSNVINWLIQEGKFDE
ncbi:hypothetical protein [Haemophilus parahaemolyticus]|uniref:hypothetical protein n=1 Tax=Haemophilus parahaemolyticus TaxID=735 RepID=UPI0028E2DBA2|nr:hypothetical protein [Haemophilus parahaemolyticus]